MKVALYGPKNPETVRFFMQLNRHERQAGLEKTELAGFLHSDPALKGKDFYGYPIFGGLDAVAGLAAQGVKFVSLITGSTIARFQTARGIVKNGGELTSLIHPDVDLFMSRVGPGAYIQEQVVIQANVTFGNNCSVHIGCMIAHDVRVGNSAFISFAVAVSGEVEIGDGTFVGANATILPRIKIGKFATVGAGAVVNRDVADYTVVAGNPARAIKQNPPELQHGDVYAD